MLSMWMKSKGEAGKICGWLKKEAPPEPKAIEASVATTSYAFFSESSLECLGVAIL